MALEVATADFYRRGWLQTCIGRVWVSRVPSWKIAFSSCVNLSDFLGYSIYLWHVRYTNDNHHLDIVVAMTPIIENTTSLRRVPSLVMIHWPSILHLHHSPLHKILVSIFVPSVWPPPRWTRTLGRIPCDAEKRLQWQWMVHRQELFLVYGELHSGL